MAKDLKLWQSEATKELIKRYKMNYKNFGLKKAAWANENSKQCANIKCERLIVKGNNFYWDAIHDLDYCEQCGKCLRYMRKKAEERDEPIEGVELE